MNSSIRILALAAALTMAPFARGADALLPGDPARGDQLYAAKCAGCHASMFGGDGSKIFTRPDHKVRTVEGLMGQVDACEKNLGLSLSRDDINDLVSYLNQHYYHFTQK